MSGGDRGRLQRTTTPGPPLALAATEMKIDAGGRGQHIAVLCIAQSKFSAYSKIRKRTQHALDPPWFPDVGSLDLVGSHVRHGECHPEEKDDWPLLVKAGAPTAIYANERCEWGKGTLKRSL